MGRRFAPASKYLHLSADLLRQKGIQSEMMTLSWRERAFLEVLAGDMYGR